MPAPIPNFEFDKRFTTEDQLVDFLLQKPGASNTLYAANSITGEYKTEIGRFNEYEASLLNITLDELNELIKEELKAIDLSMNETPDFDQALAILKDILTKHPKYASALNNRAQVHQLRAVSLLRQIETADDPAEKKKLYNKADMVRISAMSDLNQAINIAYSNYPHLQPEKITQTPDDEVLQVPLVLIQSLCQRGILHRVRENYNGYRFDMQSAAALGSDFAKTEIVSLNPIAQLAAEFLPQILAQIHQ